jgi:hypothetical protein
MSAGITQETSGPKFLLPLLPGSQCGVRRPQGGPQVPGCHGIDIRNSRHGTCMYIQLR